MTTKTGVYLIIQDVEGNELETFPATADTNIAGQANQHNCDVPVACCSGACFVCACRVLDGAEYIDTAKFGQALVTVQDGQVLTCIAGVKDKYLEDGDYHEIILQKLL